MISCPFIPILDRVVCRKAVEKAVAGSLEIAEQYRQASRWAEVIARGPGASQIPVGAKVLFSEYGAEFIEIEGEELIILSIHDIRGYRDQPTA